MKRKLALLLLIGGPSTSMWAQWNAPMPQTSACGPLVLWGCGGAEGVNPAGPDSPDWCAVVNQANGGIGPYCAHHWNPAESDWSDQCYSYYYQCRPPATAVGGCPGDCTTGEPINLANGNTFIQQTDVRIPGLGNRLSLTRTWNSIWPPLAAIIQPQIGMFCTQWLSTYEEQVSPGYDTTMKYTRADGSVWSFALYGSPLAYHLIAPGNVQAATLTEQSTTSWTVTFQNGEKRVFNGLSGGPLSAIIDRNGNITSLTYDANNRLTTVTDPVGRHLYFTYASDTSINVTNVTSDSGSGINLTYSYALCYQLGSCSIYLSDYPALTQVTQADNTFVTFTYNSALGITSVNDTNGKVLESHNYDTCYGGLSSSRANGVEALSIIFSDAPYCGVP